MGLMFLPTLIRIGDGRRQNTGLKRFILENPARPLRLDLDSGGGSSRHRIEEMSHPIGAPFERFTDTIVVDSRVSHINAG